MIFIIGGRSQGKTDYVLKIIRQQKYATALI